MKEGPRKEEIAGARAQLARAQAAVRTAQANRIDLRRKQEQLVERRADIDRARAQVGITEAQLNDTVIASPIDGVVLVKSAEPGEVIAAGTTIVRIGDVDHPWLRAYVGETDLGRVKLGTAGESDDRFLSGQGVSRHGIVHRFAKPSSRPSRFRPKRSA